jgi:hypothetical protein
VTASPPTPREGRALEQGPFVGVPDHLGAPLTHWLRGRLIDPAPVFDFWHAGPRVKIALIHRVTLVGRIRLPGHPEPMDELTHVLDWWQQDPEQFLDFIHYFLQEIDVAENDVKALDRTLERGGSVWRATDRGLERWVDPAATAAFEMAASPEDTASDELAVAWTKAYGRDPDLSDAWDHAIKAVEAVLIPIVVPTQAGAHIGHVIGQLDRQGEQWNTLLRFNQTTPPVNPPTTSVQALVGMLRLIYPNPDRHLGPDHRVPTIEEARAVVHLAVTIVQWGRDDLIVRRAADDA